MCKIEEISSVKLTDYEPPYYLKYDKGVKKIFQKKVLKQLFETWQDTIKWLMVYRQFEIDTNPMMEMITRIFMFVYRTNKQILAEKKAERKRELTKRKKLYTLRNKKMLYKTI
jgi:hypothetical protein